MAVGVALALWGVTTGLLLPLSRGVWALFASPAYGRARSRAVLMAGSFAFALLAALAWLPAPLHTHAEGVVWLPEKAIVRAGTDGFVRDVRVPPGSRVAASEVLIRASDPELEAELRRVRAREAELNAKLDAVRFNDRVEAIVTEAELRSVRTEREQAQHRIALLEVRAQMDGVFVMPAAEDMPGRFYRRGDLVGYTLPAEGARTIRITVAQENIALVRRRLREVHAMLVRQPDHVLDIKAIREVPAGSDRLPSPALGTLGGGEIAIDPRDQHGVATLNRTFQLELELALPLLNADFGGRVLVRFEHEWEPLGPQLWRRVRQLLLSRLDV